MAGPKKVRDALAASIRRIDEAERVTRRGSWEWDTASNRAVWSRGMYLLFGLDPDSFVNSNENFLAMVHPGDRDRMGQAILEALARPGPFLQEYRLTRPDGVELHIRGEGNVVHDGAGKARLLYGFVQDISDKKRADAALREAERLALELARHESERLSHLNEFKTNFLNMVAHDLNNIVTPMRLNVKSIKMAAEADCLESVANPVAILDRSVERITAFLADLLDAARLQSGALKINPAPVDLSAGLAAVVDALKLQAEEQGIRLEIDIPPAIRIEADARRLEQVTTNLLGNALKFTPRDGTIRVVLSPSRSEVRIDVTDTGPGIKPEDIARLFQPFTRLGTAAQGKHTGTGLGLFISKGIVEAHGGRIWCESKEGQGARFSYALPTHARGAATFTLAG